MCVCVYTCVHKYICMYVRYVCMEGKSLRSNLGVLQTGQNKLDFGQ
jgi:hypothetical protein